MIYTCLIADDNVIERDVLSMFINKLPQLKIVSECEDGLQAAGVLATEQIDIVFCDIDMPDLSGIGLLKSLRNPPVFVFITSYRDYAVESYDLDVVDFIVKPVTFERLLKAVNKATENVKLKADATNRPIATGMGELITDSQTDDHFFIKESHGITRLKYSDVIYIESLGDFSKIHTTRNQTHIVLSGLKNMEIQLPEDIFKRVHKQYIVNLNFVATVTANDVHFLDKQIIPVSATYRQKLLDIFVNKDIIKRTV
jgi:two-component system LytT family response regulator